MLRLVSRFALFLLPVAALACSQTAVQPHLVFGATDDATAADGTMASEEASVATADAGTPFGTDAIAPLDTAAVDDVPASTEPEVTAQPDVSVQPDVVIATEVAESTCQAGINCVGSDACHKATCVLG